MIEQSVDCRNAEERDPEHPKYIPKSRYSSMNHYISDHQFVNHNLSDTPQIRFEQAYFDLIKQEAPDIDDSLARHVARLFTRDPVPSYEGEYIEE